MCDASGLSDSLARCLSPVLALALFYPAEDRLFDETHSRFLEMESAMSKLCDHLEKHFASMQETVLLQQLVSQDLHYFYGARGGYFAKHSEDYKQRCTDYLKSLTLTVLASLHTYTLQPIRAHLAAMPEIKEVVTLRLERKIELEMYRSRVQAVRKSMGLSANVPGGASVGYVLEEDTDDSGSAGLPATKTSSAATARLASKQKKLDALSRAYESMHSGLMASLSGYISAKDQLLNKFVAHYFGAVNDYLAGNVRIMAEQRGFVKALYGMTPAGPPATQQIPFEEAAAARAASASNAAAAAGTKAPGSAPTDGTQLLRSFSQLRTAALNFEAQQQQHKSKRRSIIVGGTGPLLPAGGVPRRQSRLAAGTGVSLLDRAAANGRSNTVSVGPSGSSVPSMLSRGASASMALSSSPPSTSFSALLPSSSSNPKVTLYTNPPFNAGVSFRDRHAYYRPENSPNVVVPSAIETTLQAWLSSAAGTTASVAASTANTSASLLPSANPGSHSLSAVNSGSLDVNSAYGASMKNPRAIKIVSTAEFLQNHRAENLAKATGVTSASPASRRPSENPGSMGAPSVNVASPEAAGSKPNLLSPTSVAKAAAPSPRSGGVTPLQSSQLASLSPSPSHSHSRSISVSSTGSVSSNRPPSPDSPPPPPPAPPAGDDWDSEDFDTSSEEEDEEDDDEEDGGSGREYSRNSSNGSGSLSISVNSATPRSSISSAGGGSGVGGNKPPTPSNALSLPVVDEQSHSRRGSSSDPQLRQANQPILTGKFAALLGQKFAANSSPSPSHASAAAAGNSSPSSQSRNTPPSRNAPVTPTAAASDVAVSSSSVDPTPLPAFSPDSSPSATPTTSRSRDHSPSRSSANQTTTSSALATPRDNRDASHTPSIGGTPAAAAAAPLIAEDPLSMLAALQSAPLEPVVEPVALGGLSDEEDEDAPPPPPDQAALNAAAAAAAAEKAAAEAAAAEAARAAAQAESDAAAAAAAASTIVATDEPTAPPAPASAAVALPDVVVALYDYTCARPGIELSFKAGDMIRVLSGDDSGWWQGRVVGAKGPVFVGAFPSNFCRPKV